MKDDRNIEYLVGKKAKLDVFISPFSNKIVAFLDDLSKSLKNFNKKNLPDLKALSFFCRKNNISILKNKHFDPVRYNQPEKSENHLSNCFFSPAAG